ncbi:helix-turn-helix domain-containing protein [Paenibacillus tengchongensis]|uniref:helix-turn-helix domain-containing protein n=1 Tax=Paenibacillus tengchongensis TaxID=2608684 RepID=UPI00124D080C|nr:AraC family transcriptional regulator [Paenibacillus tengchongensis]
MKQEQRSIRADAGLGLELYQFKGIKQNFATHFHEYYTIGSIEAGERIFVCNGQEHRLQPGDCMLINPFDKHSCAMVELAPLHFYSFNIGLESMGGLMLELSGRRNLPYFTVNALYTPEWGEAMRELKLMIEQNRPDSVKKKAYNWLMQRLLSAYSQPAPEADHPEGNRTIRLVCEYLERHYDRNVTLDELSALAGLSKYHLVRQFTREMGIPPGRYQQNIRIGQARRMLVHGAMPAEAALGAGFADQSHFTNYFKNTIGLTPKVYRDSFQ